VIGYKLLTQGMTSHGGCQWALDEWKETSGEGELCGPGWLHYYEHPLLAVLHNPIHADIQSPRLFEVEVEGKIKRDGQMKSGCTRMRISKEIPLPIATTEQRVRYAIFCAMAVLPDKPWAARWHAWAETWLSGEDRTEEEAAKAAQTMIWEQVVIGELRAAWEAAAWAAEAAARITPVAVAWAATYAAIAADRELNLLALAQKAMEAR